MTDYLYQIPLIEIVKYLNNEDFCVFRSLCRDTYNNTLQEYANRTYCLSNIVKHIDIEYITKYLNNSDFKNFRLVNKYIYNDTYDEYLEERINVYSYGFTLYPLNHQPSGSINCSRIDNASFTLFNLKN